MKRREDTDIIVSARFITLFFNVSASFGNVLIYSTLNNIIQYYYGEINIKEIFPQFSSRGRNTHILFPIP